MLSNVQCINAENAERQDLINRVVFIRREDVQRITGMSRAWIYQAMADNRFPRPVACSPGSRRWLLSEIQTWMQQRIQERDANARL